MPPVASRSKWRVVWALGSMAESNFSTNKRAPWAGLVIPSCSKRWVSGSVECCGLRNVQCYKDLDVPGKNFWNSLNLAFSLMTCAVQTL